jgi:Dyp-type peroxidase family
MSSPVIPLDPMDFSNDALLARMQGNILKGHGRDHTTHLFLHFKKEQENATLNWIKDYLSEKVTSFKTQLWERERFKRNQVRGGLFTAFFLTAAGYEYLGYKDVEKRLPDEGFVAGMKKRLTINNDPDPAKWEKGFQEDIHAMILLADDDLKRMTLAAEEIITLIADFTLITAVEYGNVIRNENGDGIEHFGYVDGVSQPLFLKDEIDAYMAFHNTSPDKAKFDPAADKDLVLIKDPYTKVPDSFGSYFVFRKLEQNVKGFKEAEHALDMGELAGAWLVGRFEDGSPVTLTDDEGVIGAGNYNNFNYEKDPSGGRCPHFAHIRKTNPRENVFKYGDYKSHIMARRGIPFGSRKENTTRTEEEYPEKGVGLLFMSYQRSIENQFEFIQKRLANNPDFPADKNTGIDAIIGQVAGKYTATHTYKFPKEYDSNELTGELKFNQFVTMKGGEYFFAPSISFLKSLNPYT